MSFRCCSLRLPVHRVKRCSPGPKSCGSRESDPHPGDGGRAGGAGVDARPTPDGIVIQGGGPSPAGGSTAMATTVSRWRSRSAALRADGDIQIDDCANVNTSFHGLSSLRPPGAAGWHCTMPDTPPVITIDGPSGPGKGTVTQRGRPAVGVCWIPRALYRLVGFCCRSASGRI